MDEPVIMLKVSEYNKLLDLRTPKEELPTKVKVLQVESKVKRFLRRIRDSFFSYKKNVKQQKLIKYCISQAVATMYAQVYGYWGSSINDDMKEHFRDFQEQYKRQIYQSIMNELNK